jgi:hypothetical protein
LLREGGAKNVERKQLPMEMNCTKVFDQIAYLWQRKDKN